MDRDRLFLATIAEDAVAEAKAYGLRLELDHFCTGAFLDAPLVAETEASMVRDLEAAGAAVFHAPFAELSPAAVDPLVEQVSFHRLEQAFQMAYSHGVKRMVVHSGFSPLHHFPEWFLEKAPLFWKRFLADKPADFQLLVENVLDKEPRLLTEVAREVGDDRLKLCLDVGHAAVYSEVGWETWLREMSPYLAHFHIHNNDGSWDLHQSLQDGVLPMMQVLELADALCPHATYTIETLKAAPSLLWLKEQGLL